MPHPNPAPLFDAIAEAIVMLDSADASTVAELIERLGDVGGLFGDELSADHPYARLADAAERVARGDESALADIEGLFGACKEAASSSASDSPPAEQRAGEGCASATAEPARMPLAGDDDLLRDFAIRSAEHLDDADEQLLALEADSANGAAVDALFRAFHTIKGMAGFLALGEICELAHESESLLAEPRQTGSAVAQSAVRSLFSAVDRMRHLVAIAAGTPASPAEADTGTAASANGRASDTPAVSARAGTVRVEESRLDALLDAIGEMVIAESMVSASTRSQTHSAALMLQIDRLDKITRELQHMATSLRMIPLRATFRRMARLVRDVADKAGKQVDFVVIGEETELDKVVVDRISDPLVHALRNAVDHGIETPTQRAAAGKPAVGRIELRALHAGGAIHIEVIDDGRGVDLDRVAVKARERGLLGADETTADSTLIELVFEPGFSTAEFITEVSGRGVGMDVVKRTVDQLRGRVDVHTVKGEGTRIDIRLPITLAIIDGLVARVAEERYILPTLSIERSVRPRPDQLFTVTGRGEMLTVGDRLIPLIRLHRLFGLDGAQTDPCQGVVIITRDGERMVGLLACELLGQQQIVIKPLGDGLPDMPGIAGGAVMPDGRVGLIVDAPSLIRTAHTQGGDGA